METLSNGVPFTSKAVPPLAIVNHPPDVTAIPLATPPELTRVAPRESIMILFAIAPS